MIKRNRSRIIDSSDSDDEESHAPRFKRIRANISDSESEDEATAASTPPQSRRPWIEDDGSDVEHTKPDEVEVEPKDYYSITPQSQRASRRFKTTSNVFETTFKDFTGDVPAEKAPAFIEHMLNELVTDIKTTCQAQGNDKMRISVEHPALKMGIHIPFSDVSTLSGSSLLNELKHVQQSNTQFKLNDGRATLHVTHVQPPTGNGRKALHYGLFFDSKNTRKIKRSVVEINNARDGMCLARAIAVGRCHANRDSTTTWKKQWGKIRKSNRPEQEIQARALLHEAGISPDCACGPSEWAQLQAVLSPKYQLKIYPQELNTGLLFTGTYRPESKVIHVYHNQHHYDCITSITGFKGCVYYCEKCDRGFTNREDHLCPYGCYRCFGSTPCDDDDKPVPCFDCKRVFVSSTCFDNHKSVKPGQKKSICQLVENCTKCHQRMTRRMRKQHVCPGFKRCKYCKEIIEPDHRCFVQVYETKENTGKNEQSGTAAVPFIFFDFECKQDTGVHIPNFCVAHRACERCIRLPLDESCSQCSDLPGGREIVFSGNDTLKQFCDWVFSPVHKGATAIAHNFQGYDGQFILHYLAETSSALPSVVMNGSKILELKAHGVRFIDSLNFLNMALAKLPKTFGLTELKKGYFPHLANTDRFQDYIGPYLDVSYYMPDGMSSEGRAQFMEWYDSKTGQLFDFRQEMLDYCRSDVDILRRSCGEFRCLFQEYGNIDPLLEASTIASACNLVWRKNFLKPNTVAVIPHQGYQPKRLFSIKGIRWLQYVACTEGVHIQHALNGGEKRIGPYSADGYDSASGTVYEMNGCLWHGCKVCYPDRSLKHPFTFQTMDHLYDEHVAKVNFLKDQGYEVVVLWEHEYDKLYRSDEAFQRTVDQFYRHLEPIEPRDALYGGRTNATKLLHEIKEGEEIKYIDVCSLYPYVCKYAKFPLGHPVILTQEDIDVKNVRKYEGLIKCKVIPPTNLYHPVLPFKCNNRLMFPLCRTCAEETQSTLCEHSREERALIGTWVTVELFAALDRGYRLAEVYEVWHFAETSQYNKQTGERGLFSEYVDAFLKIKQEASGYPDWCKTEADKTKFVADYLEAEGIHLEDVRANPGRRAFSKIILNCQWGKLAQRNVLRQTKYMSDPSAYFQLVTDPTKLVKHVEVFDNEKRYILVNYEEAEALAESHRTNNPIVAAYVTANARLKLYSVLEPLDTRVLYFDTDSCMYVHKPNQWNPPIVNSRLGAWTDEHPDAKIVKYVSGGPKNYAYQLQRPGNKTETKCKVKGLSLDYRTAKKVNFHVLFYEMSRQRDTFKVQVDYPHRIRRKRDRTVHSEKQSKTYQCVYKKRVLLPGHLTVPYGYRH